MQKITAKSRSSRKMGKWRRKLICSIVSGGRSVSSLLMDALRVSLAQKNDEGGSADDGFQGKSTFSADRCAANDLNICRDFKKSRCIGSDILLQKESLHVLW
jgi:hypothetical protein